MTEESRVVSGVIKQLQIEIAKDVDFQFIRPGLVQARILITSVLQRIEAQETNSDQIYSLLERVPRLSPDQRETFLKILDNDYHHIAELIRKNLTRAGIRVQQNSVYRSSQPSGSTVRQSVLPSSQSAGRQTADPAIQAAASRGLPEAELLVGAAELDPKLELSGQPPGCKSEIPASGALRRPDVCQYREPSTDVKQVIQGATTPKLVSQRSPQQTACSNSGMSKYEQMMKENPRRVYEMDTTPRGLLLIINNEKFRYLSERKWSSIDMNNLYTSFKTLGFNVGIESDKTAKEMLDFMCGFAKQESLKDVSALSVIILSHGGEDDIMFGSDGRVNGERRPVSGTFIRKQDVMKVFSEENCPSMRGKPKLFITQSCRGGEEDQLKPETPDSPNDDNKSSLRRAAMADMCFVHSTSLGYKSYRQKSVGSPFVDAFTKCLERNAATMEFRDIVREVQHEMQHQRVGDKFLTLPDLTIQLTCDWYLNPPRAN